MIPKRDKKTDITSDVNAGKKLKTKILKLAEEVAAKSINQNVDLDQTIADVSKREGFNRIQIQRLVEEGNTVAYNKRYDKLRDTHDRRITFPLASLEGVVSAMGADAPPEVVNPNLSSGKAGEGEMDKAASSSIEPSYIHNPNRRLDERREKQVQSMEKKASLMSEKEETAAQREQDSTLFKIATSIVQSERQYRNGNEVFNTLLSDVNLEEDAIEGIKKKAFDISKHMAETKRSHRGFVVTLEENSTEKVANHVLGEYSLLKVAEEVPKVKEVKVQPTSSVADFQQLITLARKLEKDQESIKPAAQSGIEVN